MKALSALLFLTTVTVATAQAGVTRSDIIYVESFAMDVGRVDGMIVASKLFSGRDLVNLGLTDKFLQSAKNDAGELEKNLVARLEVIRQSGTSNLCYQAIIDLSLKRKGNGMSQALSDSYRHRESLSGPIAEMKTFTNVALATSEAARIAQDNAYSKCEL